MLGWFPRPDLQAYPLFAILLVLFCMIQMPQLLARRQTNVFKIPKTRLTSNAIARLVVKCKF